MRAGAQPRLAVDRAESRERGTVLRKERGTLGHHPANAILLGRHQPPEAKVARGELPIDLVAGYMALFDAHHAKRLRAVGRDSELLARDHDGADQRIAITGRDRKLVGKLAREREA